MHAFVFAVLLATTLSTDTPRTTVEGATFIAPAGWSIEVKGPATILTAPLRFQTLPSALRVRIAPGHPAASPSATWPASIRLAFRTLLAIAAGGDHLAGAQRSGT